MGVGAKPLAEGRAVRIEHSPAGAVCGQDRALGPRRLPLCGGLGQGGHATPHGAPRDCCVPGPELVERGLAHRITLRKPVGQDVLLTKATPVNSPVFGIVVDRAACPGQGSTSASSAVIRFNYSTWDGVALSWEAKHCWERWREHLGAPEGDVLARFCRTGLVMLDVDVAPKEPTLALFDRAGVPYDVWSPAELAQHVPGIDAGRYWPPRRLSDDEFWAHTGEAA